MFLVDMEIFFMFAFEIFFAMLLTLDYHKERLINLCKAMGCEIAAKYLLNVAEFQSWQDSALQQMRVEKKCEGNFCKNLKQANTIR